MRFYYLVFGIPIFKLRTCSKKDHAVARCGDLQLQIGFGDIMYGPVIPVEMNKSYKLEQGPIFERIFRDSRKSPTHTDF